MTFPASILGAFCVAMTVSAPASASVIYKFDFTNLVDVQSGTGNDFSITLAYATYVQTTGFAPIGAQSTTLGYPVLYAGANSIGWWGFDDDGSATISNGSYSFGKFSSNQWLSFLFMPSFPYPSTYYAAPGVYLGSVSGNAPSAFSGTALLTITDTNTVPEPSTLALTGLVLSGLALCRRRMT